ISGVAEYESRGMSGVSGDLESGMTPFFPANSLALQASARAFKSARTLSETRSPKGMTSKVEVNSGSAGCGPADDGPLPSAELSPPPSPYQ
ncbi:MAG: hypothetical protein AB2570_20160, partial [Candidatus Thiodiazotropha endolucinida]